MAVLSPLAVFPYLNPVNVLRVCTEPRGVVDLALEEDSSHLQVDSSRAVVPQINIGSQNESLGFPSLATPSRSEYNNPYIFLLSGCVEAFTFQLETSRPSSF